MNSVFRALFWVKDVFAAEFGNSDVQSNYSRLYAWMANQLGHMTLGLATALAFIWIFETLHDLALRQGGAWYASGGARLLNFGGLVMLVGVGCVVAYTRLKSSAVQDGTDHRNRIYPLPPKLGLWIGLAIAALMIALYVRILHIERTDTNGGLIQMYALTGAALTMLGAITILSKDWRALVLGYLYVAGAWWLASANLQEQLGLKQSIATVLIVVLAAVLLVTARNYDENHQKVRGPKAWLFSLVLTAATAALFWSLDWWTAGLDQRALERANITEPQWRLACAAAIAALALWFVKEFGSDIPLVSTEIATAARARRTQGHEDYPEIEQAYFSDAVWDARTDGVFYVSGAIIAIALLTQTGTVETTWASGPDFLGVLAFGLIFLIAGRRWAYRQQALDLVGSPYASRLAVLRNALELRVIVGDKLGPPCDRALSVLLEFARGGTRRDGQIEGDAPGVNFDHLIIMGRLGSGKTPLGIAISSEAALRDLEAKIGIPGWDIIRERKSAATKTQREDGPYLEAGRRDACYTRLKNLYTLVKYLQSRPKDADDPDAVARHRQTLLTWLDSAWLRSNFIGVCPDGTTGEERVALPGPTDLLVVDDINLALPGAANVGDEAIDAAEEAAIEREQTAAMREGQDVRMMREILPCLPHDRDQHTVWVIDVTSFPRFVFSDEPEVRNSEQPIPDTLAPLLNTLTSGLRRPADGSPARIAVAFVKMDALKDG